MSRGWDAWAPVYRFFEYGLHGRGLEKARVLLLDALPARGEWWLLGGGDGRFLETALGRGGGERWVVLDRSDGMLARARRRLGADRRVRWLRADLLQPLPLLPPPGGIDGVVSQFFFDCFTDDENARWFPPVAAAVRPGGHWLVTDYAAPDALEGGRRWRQKLLLEGLLYPAFRLTTGIRARHLPDLERPFLEASWERIETVGTEAPACRATLWRKPCQTETAAGTLGA